MYLGLRCHRPHHHEGHGCFSLKYLNQRIIRRVRSAPLDPDAKTITLRHDKQEPPPYNHETPSSGTGRRASATPEAAKAGVVQGQPLKGIDNPLPESNQVKAIAQAAIVVKWMEDVCLDMLSIVPLVEDMMFTRFK